MYRGFIFGAALLLMSCSAPAPNQEKVTVDISSVVSQQSVAIDQSALRIVRLSDGKQWVSNEARLDTRYPPASTSKIPHTLIALETGFASSETPFEWDGEDKGFTFWNQDQTLASAYARSAVWVYQIITSSLGHETMTGWIEKFDYGNRNIGTADDLTQYWLVGPLEISINEQIEFLRALTENRLPVSEKTMREARHIMLSDEDDGWKLYSKTGWRMDKTNVDIGWYVGWIDAETDSGLETYVFAFNVNMQDGFDRSKRKGVVYSAFENIGVLSSQVD